MDVVFSFFAALASFFFGFIVLAVRDQLVHLAPISSFVLHPGGPITFAAAVAAALTNFGLVVVLISALGYFSNYLNWRFLNYRFTQFSYYLGTFVHECSHAILCILTRARILEFNVFTSKPHVVSTPPRLPLIGQLLISIAPVFGGIGFLFLVNTFLLSGHFIIPAFSTWQSVPIGSWKLLSQINLGEWQSWVMIPIFVNVGAMIGPSAQDLKNSWLAIVALFFVWSPLLASLGLLAFSLILINIVIQAAAILAIWLVQSLIYRLRSMDGA